LLNCGGKKKKKKKDGYSLARGDYQFFPSVLKEGRGKGILFSVLQEAGLRERRNRLVTVFFLSHYYRNATLSRNDGPRVRRRGENIATKACLLRGEKGE